MLRMIPGVTADEYGPVRTPDPFDVRNSSNIFASSPPHDGVPHSDPLYIFGVSACSARFVSGVGRTGLSAFDERADFALGVAIKGPAILFGVETEEASCGAIGYVSKESHKW